MRCSSCQRPFDNKVGWYKIGSSTACPSCLSAIEQELKERQKGAVLKLERKERSRINNCENITAKYHAKTRSRAIIHAVTRLSADPEIGGAGPVDKRIQKQGH